MWDRNRFGARGKQAMMGGDAPRCLGINGEQIAVEHLVRRGYEIVERNYRTRWGELDIVARNGPTLVFCEVKTRRISRGGDTSPLDAIRGLKRTQVRRMAARWLADRPGHPYAPALRFDAIAVTYDGRGQLVAIEHIEAAW